MLIWKFTVAVAVSAPVPDVYVEAAEAMSGSATAAEMSRALLTIGLRMMFKFLSLVNRDAEQ
jgi:hypothetical protein